MSDRLDDAIGGARAFDVWDTERAARVRKRILERRDDRARRGRAIRRGSLVMSGAALLVIGLLKVASSAPASTPHEPASASTPHEPASRAREVQLAAVDGLGVGGGDAGYARD